MQRIVRKITYGWNCDPCMLKISGRQDALVHMKDIHSVPEEFIREDGNGDLYDTRPSKENPKGAIT